MSKTPENASWNESADTPNQWYRDAIWGPSLDRFHGALDQAWEEQTGLPVNLPDYRWLVMLHEL